jgi:hypothetical protein
MNLRKTNSTNLVNTFVGLLTGVIVHYTPKQSQYVKEIYRRIELGEKRTPLKLAESIFEPGRWHIVKLDGDELTCIRARTKEEWIEIAESIGIEIEFIEAKNDR